MAFTKSVAEQQYNFLYFSYYHIVSQFMIEVSLSVLNETTVFVGYKHMVNE